jgi:hypothetical protein
MACNSVNPVMIVVEFIEPRSSQVPHCGAAPYPIGETMPEPTTFADLV